MINEDKILEILIKMQETQQQMQTDFSQMREGIQQIKDRLDRVEDRLNRVEDRLNRMEDRLNQVEDRLDRVEDRATRTALFQENVMQPAINAIGEGLELTQQKMRELTSKRESDELRDQVEILRTVVALHSREIEALKKAQ